LGQEIALWADILRDAHEILAKGWFSEDALPDNIDPGHISRIPEAFRVWHGDQRAYFDRIC